jgi:hypothetical protein
MFDFDIVKDATGVVSAIGAALGGLWKFIASARERPSKAKLEAARQLVQWNSQAPDASAIRGFGEQELLRLYFKDLTGIDRRADHAALTRAHATLGGTDDDWRRLRGVAAYLERSGTEIVVRELTLLDYGSAFVSAALVLMCVASGFFFLDGLMQIAGSVKGTVLGRLIASLVLGVMTVGVAVIAWLFIVVLFHMFVTARGVREKLAAAHELESLRD